MRTIPFENKIDTEKSKCEYKDGILHVKLIKKEPDKINEVKKLTIE